MLHLQEHEMTVVKLCSDGATKCKKKKNKIVGRFLFIGFWKV